MDGHVSVEVVSVEAEAMVDEGWGISRWHPKVAVKPPSTRARFEAMSQISAEGDKINRPLTDLGLAKITQDWEAANPPA